MSDDHHLGEDLVLLALDDGGTAHREVVARHTAHLASCPDCRRAVDEARRVMVALAVPAEAPSPAFDRALFARLDALDAGARNTPWARLVAWWSAPAVPRWALAGGAALAVVLVVGATVLGSGSGGAPSDEVASALASVDDVEMAENLDLLDDLELVEELDAIEDLEAIETLDEGSAG